MHKKLTITIDEKLYNSLYRNIGKGKISQFIENLIRPHILLQNLEIAYREMSMDKIREAEANNWIEGLLGLLEDINYAER